MTKNTAMWKGGKMDIFEKERNKPKVKAGSLGNENGPNPDHAKGTGKKIFRKGGE